jgi:hypothetical protein
VTRGPQGTWGWAGAETSVQGVVGGVDVHPWQKGVESKVSRDNCFGFHTTTREAERASQTRQGLKQLCLLQVQGSNKTTRSWVKATPAQ